MKKISYNIRKIIISAGFLLISGVVLFPNLEFYTRGITTYKRGFLYLPEKLYHIDYARMTLEVSYIILLCGVLIYLFNNKD
jgi:hypothetical protein